MPTITDNEIEQLLLEKRKTKNLDPLVKNKFGIFSWIIYWIKFCYEFPLTLLMCLWGFFLALWGYWDYIKNLKKTNGIDFNTLQNKLNNTNKNFISVIIAMYNEEDTIEMTLLYLDLYCYDKSNIEVILVDGGSTDDTFKVINNIKNKLNIPIKVIATDASTTGRGICQNIGYQNVSKKSDILLFLHSDTILSKYYDNEIRLQCKNSKLILGSFTFGVDRGEMNKPLVGLGCMELFARIRNVCYWLPYGDQGYFLRREMFERLGKFPNYVICEDLEFTNKSRKYALQNDGVIFISKLVAYCSPRRWDKNGVAKNTMWNQIVVFCYTKLKYTDKQIYKLYYGKTVPTTKTKKN